MSLNKGMMSSVTDVWATPQFVFDKLDAVHDFDLDVCANSENRKCLMYFDVEHDGLEQDWSKNRFWMNPPYGRTIDKWVKKAHESALAGGYGVALIPARTDTNWWYDYVVPNEIHFIKGRLKFGDGKGSAPFPSAIVIFNQSQKYKWITVK